MYVREAETEELDTIMKIYEDARSFMRAHGNMDQWKDGDFPGKDFFKNYIHEGKLFVVDDEGEIIAVWAYILGDDPSYEVVESGSWLNDEPYGTIHRLASSGKRKRITEFIFDWALEQCPNLRGDTHADNHVMQSAAEDFGFKMCGIIHLLGPSGKYDGDPRIAYHVTRELRNIKKNITE